MSAIYETSAYIYTSYSEPSATSAGFTPSQLRLTGINDEGQLVGTYNSVGFIDSDGVYTTIQGSPNGINDAGEVVGSFGGGGSGTPAQGFVESGGVYTTIDYPSAEFTVAEGINNAGEIVGSYGDNGFLYSNGIFTTIDYPGAEATGLTSINDSGEVAGIYLDSNGNAHAFVESGGVFTNVTGNLAGTNIWINNAGEIVGLGAPAFIMSTMTAPIPP
jgi:hypothetical protein